MELAIVVQGDGKGGGPSADGPFEAERKMTLPELPAFPINVTVHINRWWSVTANTGTLEWDEHRGFRVLATIGMHLDHDKPSDRDAWNELNRDWEVRR